LEPGDGSEPRRRHRIVAIIAALNVPERAGDLEMRGTSFAALSA
jgi:hypothetical protein